MSSPSKLPARAWLMVGLLWVVGCLNYLDRVIITTMRGLPTAVRNVFQFAAARILARAELPFCIRPQAAAQP